MVVKSLTLLILSVITASLCLAQSAPRLDGSPYPVSQVPDTLFVVNDGEYPASQRLTIMTLQGLLAKTKPMIYRWTGGGSTTWRGDLVNQYGVHRDDTFWDNKYAELLSYFRNRVSGYVLCNLQDNSTNVAISLCGLLNAIAVTPTDEGVMTNLGIPRLEDVRSRDEAWVLTNYGDLFSKQVITYQQEEKSLFAGDYSVFTNAFQFFDDIHSTLTADAFSRMEANSTLFGWGTDELTLVQTASQDAIQVHPSDWAVNLSTLSNFDAEAVQHTATQAPSEAVNVHTVCFLMSDGDNVQWLLNDFSTSTKWYGSPKRGQVDIGWTMAPALSELAPTVLKRLYNDAANTPEGRDYFVAGPSGLGYIFPDEFPALEDHAALLNDYMEKADLSIVNLLGTNPAPEHLSPYLDQPNINALFYYDYHNYSALEGDISWINHKPVIGSRFNFWEGFEDVNSLATKINALPTDAYSSEGYSLIATHAWSQSVDDILSAVSLFNDDVIVVTPDEFVQRIQKNLSTITQVKKTRPETSGTFPNPSDGLFTLPENTTWQIRTLQGIPLEMGSGNRVDLSGHKAGTYILQSNNTITRITKTN